MPFGRIVELYGLESCGKTAMAIRCASRARRGFVSEVSRDGDGNIKYRQLDSNELNIAVLYIDNERSLDDDVKLNVDGVKLDIIDHAAV
jgi:RecA/RadA recombinase